METYGNAMPSSTHPSANKPLRMPRLASVQSYIPLDPPPSKRKAPAPTRLDDLLINDNEVLMSATLTSEEGSLLPTPPAKEAQKTPSVEIINEAPHVKDESHPANSYWDWHDESSDTVDQETMIKEINDNEVLMSATLTSEEGSLLPTPPAKEAQKTPSVEIINEAPHVKDELHPANSYWDWHDESSDTVDQETMIKEIMDHERTRQLLSADRIQENALAEGKQHEKAAESTTSGHDRYWDEAASVQSYPIKRKDCEVSKKVGFLIANIPLGPPPSKRKAPAPTRLDDLLINDNEVLMSADNDEDTLCKAISDWKPFVNRVAHFIDNENLPFEYFDIWEPTKLDGSPRNGDERLNEIIASNNNNGLCLRHVGHGTKGDLDLSSIFTMYQLQQFGECSEKYWFPPGVGLPGRVFETGEPIIDNALQCAQFQDFPRANLAKKFNVKKGLGIPIVSQASSAIVVLYATEDTPIDVGVVRVAYQEFHKYRARLPPTYISSENAIVQRQARRVPDEIEFAKRIAVQVLREWELLHARRHKAILPDDIEVEMAKMLAAGGQQFGERSALIFLLWRPPCRRNRVNNDLLDALKQKYNVIKKQYQDNEKIALQVLKEWGKLNLHEYSAILPDETEIEMAKMLDDYHQYSSLFFLLWRAPCRRSRTVNEFLDVLKEKYKTFKEQQDDAKKIAWQVLKEWDLLNSRDYTANSSDETEVEMAKLLMHQQENSISHLLHQVPSRRSRTENEMVDVLKHKYKALKGKNACAKKVILQIVKEWGAFTKEELATTQVGTIIETMQLRLLT